VVVPHRCSSLQQLRQQRRHRHLRGILPRAAAISARACIENHTPLALRPRRLTIRCTTRRESVARAARRGGSPTYLAVRLLRWARDAATSAGAPDPGGMPCPHHDDHRWSWGERPPARTGTGVGSRGTPDHSRQTANTPPVWIPISASCTNPSFPLATPLVLLALGSRPTNLSPAELPEGRGQRRAGARVARLNSRFTIGAESCPPTRPPSTRPYSASCDTGSGMQEVCGSV